jgi:hypothetical protein
VLEVAEMDCPYFPCKLEKGAIGTNNHHLLSGEIRRAGGVIQGVEHLPSKHKALSSNSSIAKQNNKTQNQDSLARSVSQTLFEHQVCRC